MNKSKTKVMIEYSTQLNNTQIENIKSCVYLEQRYNTRTNKQDKVIQRKIMAGWTAFAKHSNMFKGNIGTCLKR